MSGVATADLELSRVGPVYPPRRQSTMQRMRAEHHSRARRRFAGSFAGPGCLLGEHPHNVFATRQLPGEGSVFSNGNESTE